MNKEEMKEFLSNLTHNELLTLEILLEDEIRYSEQVIKYNLYSLEAQEIIE